MGPWMPFLLAVLATWRVTHLLASEDGPADIIVPISRLVGPEHRRPADGLLQLPQSVDCGSSCLFVSRRPLGWLFSWLALSGGACLLERLGQEPVVIQTISQPTEGETNDVLRSETQELRNSHAQSNDAERPPTPLRR